jgi:hypothetical protein
MMTICDCQGLDREDDGRGGMSPRHVAGSMG